jgi:nucleoside-diphosphate-sugar epimerase
MKTALIAGATGATSKRLIEQLLSGGWQVIGVCRHPPAPPHAPGLSYLRADLLDARGCAQALAGASSVTHLFYTARAPFGEGGVEDVPANVAMLANVLDAVCAAAKGLRHVHLVEGQKWYDVRLKPPRTPTREDDPRHMPPNFYYDQEDLLRERQAGSRWTWSASRPHFVYDYSPERPRNIVSTIGAWAAMCAAHGLPLDFPGSEACWNGLIEITDATQLARAIVWMAESEAARNQAYNVSDTCQFRWRWLWPRIAAHFGLAEGEVRPLKLSEWMRDKGPAWQRMVERHGLVANPLEDLASWEFADFYWNLSHDNITDTTKIRRHGFHGVVDTGEQVVAYLQHYREAKLLP